MNDLNLKKLSRKDLLEMTLVLVRENEIQRERIAELEKQLEKRTIEIREAGNIAQAALQLNRVFEACQSACDQYLESVKTMYSPTELPDCPAGDTPDTEA